MFWFKNEKLIKAYPKPMKNLQKTKVENFLIFFLNLSQTCELTSTCTKFSCISFALNLYGMIKKRI